MVTLEEYRANADTNNLCAEYKTLWDSCSNNKQLIDLCLSSKGVDYLCDSIAKGWGITSDTINERFNCFINGKYKSNQEGYDSQMFCRYKGAITADTTLVTLVDSDVDVVVPDFMIAKIYCTGKTNVRVRGNGEAIIIHYGDNVSIEGKCRRMKTIHKKDRDYYE